MNKRVRLVVVVGILLLVLFCLMIYLSIRKSHNSPSYSTTTINKDTGQTIVYYPHRTPEHGGGNNQDTTLVLGLDKLLNAGMTQDQMELTKSLLKGYVYKLPHKYTQVAILNNGFSSTGTKISAKLRLDNSSSLLTLTIKYTNLQYVEISISSQDSSYNYSSGVVSVNNYGD